MILLSPTEWNDVQSGKLPLPTDWNLSSREKPLMPITPRDWSDLFLEQAREDLRAAWLIPSEVSASTLCMLIQMVFEKLAKAAYSRGGHVVPKTHQAASHLFAMLLRHPAGKTLLQASPNVQQFVMELEAAQPSIAGKQFTVVAAA